MGRPGARARAAASAGGRHAWREYGWHAAPDIPAAQREHEALCVLLEEAGAEVIVSEHDPGNPDAIYTLRPGAGRGRGCSAAAGPARKGAAPSPMASRSHSSRRAYPSPAAWRRPPPRRAATRSGSTADTLLVGQRLPHERRRHRRAARRVPRRRRGRARPAALERRRRGHAPDERSSRRSTAIWRLSTRGSRRCACSSCLRSAGCGRSRCRTRSSRAWPRTCSRSGHAGRSPSRGTTRPGAALERAGVDVAHLRRRRDLPEGRRRADVPDPSSCAARTAESSSASWRWSERPETPTPTSRSAPGRSRRPRSSRRQARSPIRSASSIGAARVVDRLRIEKSA